MPDQSTRHIRRIREEASSARLWETLVSLPGPRSRIHHPQAMADTDLLLTEAWRKAGWCVSALPFSLQQAQGIEDFDDFAATVYQDVEGVNLVAVKAGMGDGALVIGAHHDTVRDSPGACDNGAALAALVEIARLLAPVSLHKTVILAAFDMEELGVLGSPQLVPELARQHRIDCALILESIGYANPAPRSQRIPFGFGLLFPRQTGRIRLRRRRADWTAAIYRGSAAGPMEVLRGELRAVAGRDSVIALRDPLDRPVTGPVLRRLMPSLKHLARSDHAAFWQEGLPAIQLTDTANFRSSHYHRPSDTVETLDLTHLRKITAAVATTAVQLAGEASS
ncbi:M28 family peptidase [Streptomyces sp. NPDC059906]|uniref:M28 family peptidase n=1 Tax=Streptomyces sp. NPDC059906 TaxID=3346997 RepID=UPI00366164B1